MVNRVNFSTCGTLGLLLVRRILYGWESLHCLDLRVKSYLVYGMYYYRGSTVRSSIIFLYGRRAQTGSLNGINVNARCRQEFHHGRGGIVGHERIAFVVR
jgi:hypothetical protein